MAMTILLQQPSCSGTATDTSRRYQSSHVDPKIISQLKYDRSSVPRHKLSPLRDLKAGFVLQITRNMKNVAVVHASAPPQEPFPTDPADPSPAHDRWRVQLTLGTIVAILLSFSRIWLHLLKLKEKVETTIKQLEQISFAVEKAAEKVEQMAETAAKRLPDGKLHDAVVFIEKLAEQIDKVAHLAVDLLEKVEEMGRKVNYFINSAIRREEAVVSGEKARDQK